MNTINLSKSEMQEILNGKYIKGEFEKHYRHNGGYQEVIFENDGKNYSVTYLWFEDDGIYWDDKYEATEVKLVDKVVKVWETDSGCGISDISNGSDTITQERVEE
jgi:hypothetical protein